MYAATRQTGILPKPPPFGALPRESVAPQFRRSAMIAVLCHDDTDPEVALLRRILSLLHDARLEDRVCRRLDGPHIGLVIIPRSRCLGAPIEKLPTIIIDDQHPLLVDIAQRVDLADRTNHIVLDEALVRRELIDLVGRFLPI